jgi:hypothetical protein
VKYLTYGAADHSQIDKDLNGYMERALFPLKTIGREGWKPLFRHVFLSFAQFIGQKKNTYEKPKLPFIGAEEMG